MDANHAHHCCCSSRRDGPQSPLVQPSPGPLTRSLPSTHSLASALSPGASTPGSWTAHPWSPGSSNTSPPSTRSGSPELKVRFQTEKVETTVRVDVTEVLPTVTKSVKSICFVGAGFVGGPTAAVIAYHNPDITVNVVDLNEQRIAAWNSSQLPIHEDGLLKVVRTARDGTLDTVVKIPGLPRSLKLDARSPNLVFSTKVTEAIEVADVIFICVNTPTKTYGLGAGSMADISMVESASRTVAQHAKKGAIIVEKSTVPCGTARVIQDIFKYYRPNEEFEILSNPEFLAEGTAVENLMHPDRILIGSARTLAGMKAAESLKNVYAAWVPQERIITVNTFSSELSKLVANTMLAQRISSMNAVSAMCEEIGLGSDVDDVSLALGQDSRIGPKFLQAGVGFGGSCFEKDILNLSYLARELHLDVVADYWMGILKMNEYQRERYAHRVVKELNGSLRGKKISVLGFAFKDGTNDTRNSIAVHIIKSLAEEMPLEIAIFDPGCAANEIMEEIEKVGLTKAQLERVKVCSNWRDSVKQASAVCILTQWKQFRGAQLGRTTKKAVKTPSQPVTKTFVNGKLTEMAILELEAMVARDLNITDEDPLHRLKPEAAAQGYEIFGLAASMMEEISQEPVNWYEAASLMQEPRWVFDGRNVVDPIELQGLGFKVRGIGK
ncbi:nucleotide sugar dehydrogenase [Sordaria brevicollis]|uniref:UDP-glucose 6-dehydrogenase n=1 Tax=Sordaria brevicollis TaxID=83679 RepID=A0AAE0PG46_SORBR|nr:nucleotide sugar dehydrogenase [Sordaria brevicollis]